MSKVLDHDLTFNLIIETVTGAGIPQREDDFAFIRKCREENPMILQACSYRTSSTYFGNILARVCNLYAFRYSQSYFDSAQELHFPALCFANSAPSIGIQHIKRTLTTTYYLQMFGIKTFVVTRNIFSSIISVARFMKRYQEREEYDTGAISTSFAWCDNNDLQLSDAELVEKSVYTYTPWYIHFFTSWATTNHEKNITVVWTSYEEIKADIHKALDKVITGLDLPIVRQDWDTIIQNLPEELQNQQADANSIDYWNALLKPHHKEYIKNFARFYPNIDFSIIGL